VNIEVSIMALMGIDIRGNALTLKLAITTTWLDPRLNFYNLKVSTAGCPVLALLRIQTIFLLDLD
jgi:hypothetical protein